MEEWNSGMMGKELVFPLFQYSIIPIFQCFFSVDSVISVVKRLYSFECFSIRVMNSSKR